MRIISGTKKGHPLKAPPGTTTRPTTDRVREAIFNVLQTRIADARILDVFAGSGGMSMEALSRGAAFADLYEEDRKAITAIRQNIAFLQFAEKSKLWMGDAIYLLSQNTRQYDIIFLDINMTGMDGIQTAKFIRKLSGEVYLVFITAFITYAIEGYKYNVARYLLKGNKNFEAILGECLDSILAKMDFKVESRVFEFIEGKKIVNIERILYIESSLHKIIFYIVSDKRYQYRLYGKLNTIEESLKSLGFVRIHQSYLVNIRYIKMIKNYKAILTTGDVLPMSKSKYKFAKELFIEYKGEI